MAKAEDLERKAKEEQNSLANDMLKLLSNNDKNKIEDFNPHRSLLDKLCNFHLKDIILPEDSKKKLYHILQENNKPGLNFDQVKEKATTQIEGYKTLLVRFLKASVAKDVTERSQRLGEAAGFAVKMLMSSACGKKKRRMKFRKFK
jgi:hypothetical protein